MLYIRIDKALYHRISECLKLRLREIEGFKEFSVHNLLYILSYLRILHALLYSVES